MKEKEGQIKKRFQEPFSLPGRARILQHNAYEGLPLALVRCILDLLVARNVRTIGRLPCTVCDGGVRCKR